MTDVVTATTALKERAALITAVPVFWYKELNILPDSPNPFVVFELEVQRSELVGFGGGRGENLYRFSCELLGYLAVQKGRGSEYGSALAEAIAAVFRSFRDSNVSCFDSTPRPVTDVTPDASEGVEVGNYDWYLIATTLHFDQVG